MLTRNRKILLLGAVVLSAVASTVPEFAQKFRAEELRPGSVRFGRPGLLGNRDAWTRRAAVG